MATLTATVDGLAMSSVAEAVEKVGGIEEEWFFEGTASGFRLAGGASEYRADGRWSAESSSQAPFRTRLLVVRPGDPARFNGTVIVNWNNVSAGESFEPPRSRGAARRRRVRRRRCLRAADRCGRRRWCGEPGSRCRHSRPTTRSGTDRWPIPVTTTRSTSSPRPRSCWDRTARASRTRCPASRCAMSSPPEAHSPALGS